MERESNLKSSETSDVLVTDPRAAIAIGARLDAGLGECRFDRVVIWNEPDSAVLAHLVGSARDVPVVRATQIEGLVELVDPIGSGDRALLLAPAFAHEGSWRALASLVSRAGAEVAALAAIDPTPALGAARKAGEHVVVLDAGGGAV